VKKYKNCKNMDILYATYKNDFSIELQFSNNEHRIVNFEPILKKYAKGENEKYLLLSNFKKFKVELGNIVWGKNWDIILPVNYIYAHSEKLNS